MGRVSYFLSPPPLALLPLLTIALLIAGCGSQATSTKPADGPTEAATQQALRVADHDHWGDLHDTQVDFEYQRLFGSEPLAPMQIVVHVTGRLGELGRVSSDTVTWVTNPSDRSPQYASVAIITRDRYGYSASEAAVTERAYWPIDVNTDAVDDLLALAWRHGEASQSEQDSEGIWQTRRHSVDEPMEVRLITRGPRNGQALAITSDRTFAWPEVLDNAGQFVPLLEKALIRANDLQWQQRLDRALLTLQAVDDAPPGE